MDRDGKIEERKRTSNKPKVIHKGAIKTDGFVRGSVKNYPIRFNGANHVKFASDEINKVGIIAGEKVTSKLRVAKRLESYYKEPSPMWEKLSGKTFIMYRSNKIKVEIHWYEANGKPYELKVKRVIKNES